jgi:hypothetical protein
VDYYGVEEKTEFSNTPPLQFIPNFKKIKEWNFKKGYFFNKFKHIEQNYC